MSKIDYQPGDWVVYRKSKVSSSPGPRAHNVHPTRGGDDYTYIVDKYWVVAKVLDDGDLVLRTPRRKTHQISPSGPDLRAASLLGRWFRENRFVEAERSVAPEASMKQAQAS